MALRSGSLSHWLTKEIDLLMWQKVFCVACLCLLAACSSLPPGDASLGTGDSPAESANPAEGNASDESRLVLDTIVFAQRTASASADEQRKEISVAAKLFARDRNVASRLRYGVLLSLPTLLGADVHRALATLEPLATSGDSGPVRQFATLIVQQISERVKEQRRAQQLKEQLDESHTSERVMNERASQLKIQLDELRAVERALIERGRPKK